MPPKDTIFEETYRNYLRQIDHISFDSVADKLGAKAAGDSLRIPLFQSEHEVFTGGIVSPSGRRPTFDVCVILSKYILLCPDIPPEPGDWVSFKDFKDSAPLKNYFTNDVERAIGTHFSGRLDELHAAGHALGGYPPALEVRYDLAVQFDALPKIPVILLYNDADDEFAAACSVLFESRADQYLDPECLAMLGWQLFRHLKRASANGI